MLHASKTALLSLCVLAVIAIGVYKFFEPRWAGATNASLSHVSQPSTLANRITASVSAAATATASKPTATSTPASQQGQGSRPTSQPPVVTKKQTTGYAFADGPYSVRGNAIIGADGKRYLFHGIGRDSLEYNCWGDGHFDAQEQIGRAHV